MDVSKLKIGENSYDIKDTKARTDASTALTNANSALTQSGIANTNATNALNKINNTKIVGTYNAENFELEISLDTNVVSTLNMQNGNEEV